MHNLWQIMLVTNTIFTDLLRITLTKLQAKFQLLKDLLIKGGKSAKTHELCIIMLIIPSWYNFLEKIIVDLQITMDRVHLVQIASCSDYCITTDIM